MNHFLAIFKANQNLNLGDECTLKDGTKGKCAIDRQCPYALELLKNKKANQIVRCGFSMRSQVVCCKDVAARPPLSPRFQKALCEGNVERAPVKPSIEFHIINGEEAEKTEFPLMAALGYESENNEPYDFKCGGTLVSDNYVLTAAHCVNRKDLRPLIVRLGRVSSSNLVQYY